MELLEFAGLFVGLALVAALSLRLLLRSAEALAQRRRPHHHGGRSGPVTG